MVCKRRADPSEASKDQCLACTHVDDSAKPASAIRLLVQGPEAVFDLHCACTFGGGPICNLTAPSDDFHGIDGIPREFPRHKRNNICSSCGECDEGLSDGGKINVRVRAG